MAYTPPCNRSELFVIWPSQRYHSSPVDGVIFVASTAQIMNSSREKMAFSRAAKVLQALKERGVDAVVTGSLAAGKFGPGSDVDFLVRLCPKHLRYALEASVEDIMLDIPFDLSYLDELSAPIREQMVKTVATAEELAWAARD